MWYSHDHDSGGGLNGGGPEVPQFQLPTGTGGQQLSLHCTHQTCDHCIVRILWRDNIKVYCISTSRTTYLYDKCMGVMLCHPYLLSTSVLSDILSKLCRINSRYSINTTKVQRTQNIQNCHSPMVLRGAEFSGWRMFILPSSPPVAMVSPLVATAVTGRGWRRVVM